VSILMTITFEDGGKESRVVPLATLDEFRHSWVPASRACGLGLISALEGLEILAEQVPLLTDELKRLRTWFQEHGASEQVQALNCGLYRVLEALGEIPRGRKVIVSFR
jgi:hypothetical protein